MSTTKIRSSNQLWIDDVLNMGMSGTNLRIVSLAEPISGSDAATKGYVDAVKSGLDIKDSVRAATIGDNLVVLATTSTLTNNSTLTEFTLDGLTGFAVGTRVLIKDQTDKTQNGIYTVTKVGSASVAWVLTRALDFDNTPGIEVTPGAFTFVEEGNTNADSGWVLTTNGPITIGSSLLSFTQFSGAGQIDAGFGLTKSGNKIDIASTGGGSLTLTENSINLSTVSVSNTNTGTNNLLVDSVTVDGYGRTTAVHRSDIGAVKWGSFNVTGVTTLDNLNAGIITGNTGTFSGVVNLNGGLNVNNSSTNLKGAVTIQGATVINNTLNVTGQTTLGNVNVATITPTTEFVSGTATINSLNVTGSTALIGATTVWAPVTINNALSVTGTTNLYGLLNVSLEITTNDFTANGFATFNNEALFNNTVSFQDYISTEAIYSNGVITSYITGDVAPFVIASTTKVDNLNADLLDGYHSYDLTGATMNEVGSKYVKLSGDTMTGPLTIKGTLNVTGVTTLGVTTVSSISSPVLTSTVSTGTAPLTVASTTRVANLNADLLDGYHAYELTGTTINLVGSQFVKVTGDTITGNLQISGNTNVGNKLGCGSLSVTGGSDFNNNVVFKGSMIENNGTTKLYGNTLAAAVSATTITSTGQIISTVTGVTAPFVINSSTVVSNLNADLLDGLHSSSFVQTGTTVTINGTSQNLSANRTWNVGTITGITVSAGDGLTGGGTISSTNGPTSGTITVSHADTSSAGNISSDNSNGVVIQDINFGLDTYGHVTSASVGTVDLDARYIRGSSTITVTAGAGLTGGGTMYATGGTVTVSHADTSSASNISSDNSNGVVIQDITVGVDTYGHVTSTSIGTIDLDTRYLTTSKTITIVAGTGMTGGGVVNLNGGTITIGHVDVAGSGGNLNVTGSSGQNIQSITLGVTPLGHVTGASATLVDFDTRYITTGKTSTVTAGAGLTGGGSFTNGSGSITVSHADTSSAGNILSSNFYGVAIQSITVGLDTYGHVTGTSVGTVDLDTRYFTEAESISKFLQVTGGTINGNIIVTGNTNINGVLSTSQFYSNSAASFLGDVTFVGPVTANTMSVTSLGANTINTTSLSATTVNATGQIISTVTTGTPPLVVASTTRVANLNADLLDGYHASDFTNAFRKYRLAPTVSSGTTVTFSYAGVNGGAITVQSDSFELFKNGLLMNDNNNNDYLSTATINTTAKTITFTVIDTIFNDSNPDVFLLNFSYTK